MNMVSNLCKIDLKDLYDFWRPYISRAVFHAKFVLKGYDFWKSYILKVVLPRFVIFYFFFEFIYLLIYLFIYFFNFVFEDHLKRTCLLCHYLSYLSLFVLQKEKYLLKCQIPLLHLFRGANFSRSNTYLGCFL